MEKLTGALLKALCDKPESLHAAVDVLGKLAPTPSDKTSGMELIITTRPTHFQNNHQPSEYP